jgi:VanZ family protein
MNPDSPNPTGNLLTVVVWIFLAFASATQIAGQWNTQVYGWLETVLPIRHPAPSWLLPAWQSASHIILFATLGAIAARTAGNRRRNLVVGLTICLIAELLQLLVPSRQFQLSDLLLNLISFSGAYAVATRPLRTPDH